MAGVPPPPPPPPAAGPPAAGMRPTAVTAAGVIEIVLGSLVLLLLLYIFSQIAGLISALNPLQILLLLLTLAQGILEILAGIWVLKLRPAGRILAIVMAAIGIAFQLLNLTTAAGGLMILIVLGIALRVLVIVLLNQAPARQAFVRA